MTIVGVDCATVDAKIGLALGSLSESGVCVHDATLCNRERSAVSIIAGWLTAREGALIAVDAPLGWPKPLSESLLRHTAGMAIDTPANAMFRRGTDLHIQRELGKTPLDVGADRIARTAHAALRLLADLRNTVGKPIPLAWDKPANSTISAIEVYPAATLVAHGIRSSGYKRRDQIDERREILDGLRQRLQVHDSVQDLTRSADLIDGAVCVLAGADFLQGHAMSPEDRPLAEREGWIWTAPKSPVSNA